MINRGISLEGSRVLVMGLAFKENCPDLRNTRVVDLISELSEYNIQVDVYDPLVDSEKAIHEYGLALISKLRPGSYDGIVIAVAHDQFKSMHYSEYRRLTKPKSIIYDLKYVLDRHQADLRL
jgi:UDP-N-acetyl-D-galactosamine dehydrogenase